MFRSILLTLMLLTSNSSLFSQEVLWANRVLQFSSEKVDRQVSPRFRSIQILGKPNVYPQSILSPCAWQPAGNNAGLDFIHVSFEKAIVPKTVAIAETYMPGAVSKIFGYTENKEEVLLFKNSRQKPKSLGRLWVIAVDTQGKSIKSIKLVINHSMVKGPKQYDAIGMSTAMEIVAGVYELDNIPNNIAKENLDTLINSKSGEVAPIITPDGQMLFFTRLDHPENLNKTQNFASDVWVSHLNENGNWDKAVNIGPPINNFQDNAAATISSNGKELYLLNIYKKDQLSVGLSKSVIQNGAWSYPDEVKIENLIALKTPHNNSNYDITTIEFTISWDKKVIIMALRRSESFGDNDLYVSFLMPNGVYSEPLNMGPILNSADKESSPFLSMDKKTLYFNSRGHPGYGKGDLFVTRRLDSTWTNWSEPINLGPQINSPNWEGYFTIPINGEYGYFSSTDKSLGNEDIFRIKLFPPIKPNPMALLKFKIQNDLTKQYLEEMPFITCKQGSIELEDFFFNYDMDNNEFSTYVDLGEKYSFTIANSNYQKKELILDLSQKKGYVKIEKTISLIPE